MRDRIGVSVVPVTMAACGLAVFAGALASSSYALKLATVLAAVTFVSIAIATYLRHPVLAMIGLWVFVVFNTPISAMIGYYSSTGEAVRQGVEVLVILFIGLTIRRTLNTRVRIPALAITTGAGVALFGLMSAVSHAVPLTVALLGALLGLKLWIMVALTLVLPWSERDLSRVFGALIAVGVIVATLGFLDYFTHGAVSRFLHTANYVLKAGSYRSEAVRSIFPNPGEFSLFMSLLFAVTFARFASQRRRSDLLLALAFAASIMLSLRLKGFLSLAAVVAIVGVVQGATNRRHLIISIVVGGGFIAGGYALEGKVIGKQVSANASSESSVRGRLYATGERIANDNFPLGVGYGRYASYPSRLYYSPVYTEYGLSKVYGLSPKYDHYIDDTSWPSVMGETGYGGFAVYVLGVLALIGVLVRRVVKTALDTRWLPLAALCAVAVLLVDSLGDPSLFSWLAVTTLAIILGPALVAVRPRARLPG
jgi:hypothetical protein